MHKGKSKREKELIEMAAEQFARLFWKQWHYMKGKENHRPLRKGPSKSFKHRNR